MLEFQIVYVLWVKALQGFPFVTVGRNISSMDRTEIVWFASESEQFIRVSSDLLRLSLYCLQYSVYVCILAILNVITNLLFHYGNQASTFFKIQSSILLQN